MAVVRTGSVVTISSDATTGSQSITVPSDADIMVVGFGTWDGSTDWIPTNPLTLNSVNITKAEETDYQSDVDQTWLGYLVNPDTGTQTFAWDMGSTSGFDGNVYGIAFYKNVDTTSPIVSSGKTSSGGADLTGLTGGQAPKRYLWTDAFAVCNYLELYDQTGEEAYRQLALRLVDQVHHLLGRHRAENPHTGRSIWSCWPPA